MMHNKYYEILEKFLGNYDIRVYGRSLVGKVSISQKNIALTLEELEKENILLSKLEGKQKYYYLNKQNPLLKLYLLNTEIEKTQQFLLKHHKLKLALDKVNGDIICIFGSYAKGSEKKGSDIDIFIVNGKRAKIREIGQMFNLNLSPKIYSEREFRSALRNKNPLINEIVAYHVIINGFEKFIEALWGGYYGY